MPIKLGTTDIASGFLGSTALTQIYLGAIPLLDTGPNIPVGDPLAMRQWGMLNFDTTNEGAGNRGWRVFEFEVYKDGLPNLSANDHNTFVAWNNITNVYDGDYNTRADTAANVSASEAAAFTLIYPIVTEADQINILHNDSARSIEELFLYVDEALGQPRKISLHRVFAEPQPWQPTNAMLVDAPTTGILDQGFSERVVGVLARWPGMTAQERGAMAIFLTTLDGAGILERIDEIYPLFATDEETSLKSSHRCGPLLPINNPTHVPGKGWTCEKTSGGRYLLMQDPTSAYMRYPLAAGAAGRNRGATVYVESVNTPALGNLNYLVGMTDPAQTRRTYRFWWRENVLRFTQAFASVSTANSSVIPEFPTKTPLSAWRKDDQYYFKAGDSADENTGTPGISDDYDNSAHAVAIGAYNNGGTVDAATVFPGTISLAVLWDLSTLTNADVATIHTAVDQLMADLGIAP